jgi:hypothetical protein
MENQLLNIKINQDDIEKAISNAAKARTELDKLKSSNKELEKQKKELMKADGDQSAAIESLNKQIARNSTQIKASSAVVRENEKIVTTNTQAQKANEGSITQLRKQLGIVSQQWAELSEEERENEEIGGKLAKQKLDLTEKLKAEEKATGDTRRNVGNYSEGVKEALQQTGLFGGVIGTLTQAQMVYTTTMKGATFATSSFKKALISTGIGAIVVALGSLIAFLTRTQEGLDFVSRGFAAVKTFVDTFVDALSNLGKSIISQIVPTLKGLGQIIKGVVTFDIKAMKDGFDAVSDSVSKIEPINIVEVGKAAADAAKEAARLKGITQDLVKEEADLAVEIAKSRTEILRRKQASQDENLTLQEREDLLRSAIQLEQEQINKALELKRERLEALIAEKELTNSLETDKQEIRDLEVEVAKLEEESLNKQIELQGQLRGIESKREAERQERLDKLQEATDKAIALKRKEEEEKARIEQEFAELVTQREDQRREEEKVKLAEQRAEGLITREEYEQQLLQIELNTLEAAKIAAEEAKQAAIDNTQLTELERQRIILESEAIILQARKRTADLSIQAEQKLAKSTESVEKEKVEQSKVSSADIISGTQSIAKEGSTAAKAAGVAQATISTYTAAAKALADGGLILGPIFAALVTAKGLLNVKKIVSTPTPSFADGGFTGGGYGLPDSSGYKPAGIVHEGEYVIKKSMVENPAFSGIINTLETSRLKGYADGGMVGRAASAPAQEGAQAAQLQNTISMLGQVQPIVKVTDINRVSGQAQMVRVSGELN